MKKQDIVAKCEEYGEFYMQYEKLKVSGVSKSKDNTYLQGTTEFDESQDKYLAARLKAENIKPADDDHILVFSRTNDSFRYIPVKKVRKITSLNTELDRASKLRKSSGPKRES